MDDSINQEKYLKFENLVYELLVALNYKNIKKNVNYSEDSRKYLRQVDIVMGIHGSIDYPVTAIEVKYYRPFSKPSVQVINHALNQLDKHVRHLGATHSILIVSCYYAHYDLQSIKNKNIVIWDLDTLIKKASFFPNILKKLNVLLELDKKPILIDIDCINPQQELPGETLIKQYKTIFAGRTDAYRFESWCIDVLKYLFGEYLTGWHEQCATIDGLNIRDLVCRVIYPSTSEIWELILNTLRSRYVIFEFKNYTKELTQREIITTERYLYPTALRNCAFILSREGTSKNADSVIEGAMREHGKLIVSLSYEDLSIMLKGKDNGEDPNVYLFEKIDQFLISLSR